MGVLIFKHNDMLNPQVIFQIKEKVHYSIHLSNCFLHTKFIVSNRFLHTKLIAIKKILNYYLENNSNLCLSHR